MSTAKSAASSTRHVVLLDGASLSPETLVQLGAHPEMKIAIAPDSVERVNKARAVVDEIVKSGRVVYGINTGFGNFANKVIDPHNLVKLQVNLIRSHCAGVGNPLKMHRARMVLALRINILCRGNSGIRLETLQRLVDMFNAGIVPHVPLKGTVGASGDLAPLAHIALGAMGEGPLATVNNLTWRPAGQVLQEVGIAPISLGAKEGLAMINGTQFITALGCEALVRARNVSRTADIVTALTLEALMGTVVAFSPSIHRSRPHRGQNEVAARIRSVLHTPEKPSQISMSHANCGRVQDAYALRCSPQVHGVAVDTIRYVGRLLMTEANCATDNPLIFADDPDPARRIVSGGNFHGEYPAKALDFLAIAVHEIGSISERRVERLNNPTLSAMPAFLVEQGGLNSGFMIAHCTAAALVSENKVLCHPASVDSISTSAAQEDHVSMGGFAARKAIKVVENVETIISIELMCAAQGIEFHRPHRTTPALERVCELVRRVVPAWTEDRECSGDIALISQLVRSGEVWRAAEIDVPPEARFLELCDPPIYAKL